MYTLVSASVLALDLGRHPHGALVADTVDRVLTLGRDEVADLAVLGRENVSERAAVRARLQAFGAQQPRMSTLLRGVRTSVAHALPSPAVSRGMVTALTRTLLGGLGDLDDLLRRELPLADPAMLPVGVEVALDAVTAAWAGNPDGQEVLAADLALLRSPWERGLSPVPVSLPYEQYGGSSALRELLEQVPRRPEATWKPVVRAREEGGGELAWSRAMHEASRAAWQADRLVPVARAQLAAARMFRLAPVSTTAGAGSAHMAVAAAVQATCLADVLAPELAAALLRPWRAGAT